MVIAASESFSQRNQGCSVDEGVDAWLDIAARRTPPAFAHRSPSRPPSAVRSKVKCPSIAWCDWPNASRQESPTRSPSPTPSASACRRQVSALVAALRAALPQVQLRAHFHNTRNTGLANAYAAVQAGVSRARCQLRWHRRLPVRAGGDRQHSRPKTSSTCCIAWASTPASICRRCSTPVAGCSRPWTMRCPACWSRPDCFPQTNQGDGTWLSRLATRCPRAHSR